MTDMNAELARVLADIGQPAFRAYGACPVAYRGELTRLAVIMLLSNPHIMPEVRDTGYAFFHALTGRRDAPPR